jgi:TPR repeat protein
MMRERSARWVVVAALSLLPVAPALAAAADDHARGLTAYQRGDVVGAMSALRPAARAGHAPSQALLAYILDRADFSDEALALYRDAAAQDDPEGHFGLANALLIGRGIAKDEKLALQHFSKAADLGHASAIEVVAEAHVRSQYGLATAAPEAALAAVRRAADRGHLVSMEALAQAHRSGRWGLAVDPQQAAAWQTRTVQLKAQRAAARPSATTATGKTTSPPTAKATP